MNKKFFFPIIVMAIMVLSFVIYMQSFEINAEDKNYDFVTNEIILNDEVVITKDILDLSNETINATLNDEKMETEEYFSGSVEDEYNLENELEPDGIVEQENISYDGTNTGNGLSLLGAYQGLTYYSQADSRWANDLYTSTQNLTQTMRSSGCGPTCAAMIVSSSKGAILPSTMAKIFLENGYRTANNGTAWSAFSFIADYFRFNEFYSTSSIDEVLKYIEQDKNNDGVADYFAVVSCGNGLFTTSGHYIVLIGYDGENVKIFDSYLYSGKFDTASRRKANVRVDGNIEYVSKKNFIEYGNLKKYWIFSNDNGDGTLIEKGKSKFAAGESIYTQIPIKVAWSEGEKILVDDGKCQFWINKRFVNDSQIKASAIVCYDGGKCDIIEIDGVQFWCDESCMSNVDAKTKEKYSTGTYITTSNLNVRNGPNTSYKIKKVYKKNTTFSALEIKDNWARTPSGWVCLKYARRK